MGGSGQFLVARLKVLDMDNSNSPGGPSRLTDGIDQNEAPEDLGNFFLFETFP